MKVLVVNPSLFAPFYDIQFCRALVDTGASVTLVGRPLRPYERELHNEPFAFADLFYRGATRMASGWQTSRLDQMRKGLEHGAGLYRLDRLSIVENADVVNFQWLVLPFLDHIALRRLSRRCGLVLTVHNADIVTHSRSAVVGKVGGLLQTLGQERAVACFDRFIAHTDRTVRSLVDLGISSTKIVRLSHPPLELDVRPSSRSQIRRDERRNILFFGQIKPYKGVDLLVDAGISMAARRRDFRITIAGRPFLSMDAMRTRIESAGASEAFHLDLDYISDEKLAGYLEASDIVVFPYREIDGSGALSHAVLFDKPIVASRVGGFAESPFSEFIELVPPNDPNALEVTLSRLLDNPVELLDLGQRTMALRNQLPSWRDYATRCRQVFGEITRWRYSA